MKTRQGLRFLRSLYTRSLADEFILSWIDVRRSKVKHKIEQTNLKTLDGWTFTDSGVFHNSGKFFQIHYLRTTSEIGTWDQPIINQPEIGILGFITREINGCLHFLVQAKIEPGNINIVQLSPTVQSTKSNFTKVHGGSSTPFVDYFLTKDSNILVDQLQSEQGSRFFQKRNRNIIIEINEDLRHENYLWMTLGDLVAMSKYPNTVNMDSRTVMSCIHFGSYDIRGFEIYREVSSIDDYPWMESILRKDIYVKSIPEILSTITNLRFRREIEIQRVSLSGSHNWDFKNGSVSRIDDEYFDVVGMDIFIENRESSSWSQPMILPKGVGICCFFAKKIEGVYFLLVQLKDEIGSFDGVEMAPTIQTSIENLHKTTYQDIFNEHINTKRVLMDIKQSEEGGRFFQEQNRNIILDVSDLEILTSSNYIWMTINQIKNFLQYNNYVNIQTRSIISSLPL